MEQEYDLGVYLRRRYASLLGDGRYSNNVVHVQSELNVNLIHNYCILFFINCHSIVGSNQIRTLRSAAVCLAGLFPTKYDQIWNRDLSWQSIPIHTVETNMDYILYPGKKCPLYERTFKEYLQSPEFIALMEKYEDLFSQLEKQSGMTVKSFHDAKDLYDILWIEKLHNNT